MRVILANVQRLPFWARVGTAAAASSSLFFVACGFPDYGGFKDGEGGATGSTTTSSSAGGAGGATSSTTDTTTTTTTSTSTGGGCDPGKADCNDDGTCETNTNTSITDCGGCGNKCGTDNASPVCNQGTCVEACAAGWGDCDGTVQNGCETDVTTSLKNCGDCGKECNATNATAACMNGTCMLTCAQGFLDCDLDPSTGCESNPAIDPKNCGACGSPCTNAHGATSCVDGTCSPSCDPGFADCDSNPKNGCEKSTSSDVANCGGCGITCMNANGTTSCSGGVCVPMCTGSFKSCDNNPTNGCETDTSSDSQNCGQCGTTCAAPTTCLAGTCSCTPDADEPDEDVQAPGTPPMGPDMRVFDTNNNTFDISAAAPQGRTTSKKYTMSTNADVDVHYLTIHDDVGAGKVPLFAITLSGVPAGATYTIRSLYYCNTGVPLQIYNTNPAACDPNDAAHTGDIGGWFYCMQDATNASPSPNYVYGIGCGTNNPVDGDDSGILQVEVKIKTPPNAPTCAQYTLTVNVAETDFQAP